MKKILLLLIIIINIISCISMQEKENSSVLIGKDDGQIGIVNNWKNPNFKGGKTTTIIAEGYANSDSRGEANAIERALESAKRNAVEQAVGSIINSQTTVKNNKLIEDKIYEKTTGYISSYKILSINKNSSVWQTKIEATVGVDLIQDNLQAIGILLDRKQLPAILILVFDKEGNINTTFNTALEKNMSKKGFKFVSARTLNNTLEKENIDIKTLSKNKDYIKQIANITKSQVVITGKADASFFTSIQGTALKSYRSDIAIIAINISDYSTIARTTYQVGGVGGTDEDAKSISLVKSAENITEDFSSQILAKWQEEIQSGSEYTIYVYGLDFSSSIDFEEELKKNIGDIKEIYNRGLSGDTSTYLVKYMGSSKNLAIDINRSATKMGYKLLIDKFDDKTITIKANKKE